MKPFVIKEISKPSFFETIIKKNPEINLVIEINNRLSSLELNNVTGSEIKDLFEGYKISKLSNKIESGLIDLLNEFLSFHLGNSDSPYNDYYAAKKFQNLLNIDDKVFSEVYNHVAESKTQKLLLDIVEDKEITNQEEKILGDWKNKINLSDDQMAEVFKPIGERIVTEYINEITADERISPEEEAKLTKLVAGLKSKLELDEKSQAMLNRMRLMWEIENGNLDPIPTEILLPKNELCFFINDTDLYETRKITKRISYGGPTMRVKIIKGVYFRAGNLGVKAHSEEELTLIDSGKLYITNKRLLFVGSKQNKPVQLNNIIDYKVYGNGLEVSRDSGKNPFYKMSANAELAGAYLARCLKDSYS